MQQVQVSIPKPCHEDWNKMSPKEQGRFCDKCCKTVVDFSNKSPEEVQQILQSRLHEKICGRFRNDQLREPVRLVISFSPFKTRMNAAQIFLVALLFTFGTSLFSCTTHQNERVGKLSLDIPQIEQTSEVVYATTGEVIVYPEIVIDKTPKVKKVKPIVKVEFEARCDTPVTLPEVNVVENKIPLVYSHLMGAVIRTVYYTTEYQDLPKAEKKVDPVQNDLVVYPNPAQEKVHVQLNLQNETRVQAELYDMSGKLVRILIDAREINPEQTEFEFNISDLPPATYLVRIVEGDQVLTKRLVVI